MASATHAYRRWVLFGLWLLASVAISWKALDSLLHYSLGNDDASHILLIPPISLFLIFIDRRQIFRQLSSDAVVAVAFLIPGILSLLWSLQSDPPSPPACALGLVLLCISGFALFLAARPWRRPGFH